MKTCLFAMLALLAPLSFGQQSVPEHSLRVRAGLPQTSAGDELRRGSGRGGEFERSRLRIHALQQRHRSGLWSGGRAVAQVRPERRVPARNRKGTLRLVGGPQRAHRQGRQHLGHRQGSDTVIKFNQAGRVVWVFGRRSESADEEAKPWTYPYPPRLFRWTGCSASRPTLRGTRKATSTSPTDT